MDVPSAVTRPDMSQLRRLAGQMLPPAPDLELITRLAAVGITVEAWRESPVEEWHGEGRMTDGEMMRINSMLTWEVLEHLREWCAECGLDPGASIDDLEAIECEAFNGLAADLLGWITDHTRVLANYESLGEFAADDLDDLGEHAVSVFSRMMSDCAEYGVGYPFLRAAIRGAGSKWWGTHQWPSRVGAFIAALGDPAHDHWSGHEIGFPQTRPAMAADHRQLEHLLLEKPWDLDHDTARWVIQHGLNYVIVGKT